MKSIQSIITFTMIAGLLVLGLQASSCCDCDPYQITEAEKQLNLLNGTWATRAGAVSKNGSAEPAFDRFQITFSGILNYNKNNVVSSSKYNTTDESNTFPTGTWTFNGNNANQILRENGVVMTISSISEYNMELRFTINEDGTTNTTSGLIESWIFELYKL